MKKLSILFLILFSTISLFAQTKIIFDTDMDTDCDDAGALAVLHALADNGEAEILATIVSTRYPYSAPCVEAINRYYDRPDIPIGAPKTTWADTGARGSAYAHQISTEYTTTLNSNDDATDAVTIYRQVLSTQPDHSVVILTVGYLTNIRDLLASGPDEISPLTGVELIKQKVSRWVQTGAAYPSDYNTAVSGNYTPDPTSAHIAFRDWPEAFVPMYISGEGDDIQTGDSLSSTPTNNPVRRAYELRVGLGNTRASWDQIGTLFAVRPNNARWTFRTNGYYYVFENGTYEWRTTPDKNQTVLEYDTSLNAGLRTTIEQLMVQPPGQPAGQESTAYWRFEEGTAGIAHSGHNDNWYIDSSGNDNHLSAWGSETNPPATSDIPFGTVPLTQVTNTLALKFTGSQNISTTTNSPLNAYTFPNGFTVECMVKYNDFNFGVAVCKEGRPSGTYDDPNFCIKRRGTSPYQLQLQFFDGNGKRHDLRSDMTPNTGIWYSVAAVCNGSDARLYIKHPTGDYELVAEEIGTVSGSALYSDNQKWIIGRSVWAGSPTDYLNGFVDEVRITNVALNVSQFLGTCYEPPPGNDTILFEDSYTVSGAGGDINFEYTTRQSGIEAPIAYTQSNGFTVTNAGPKAGKANVVTTGHNPKYLCPDHNFTESGNLSVECDITRNGSDGDGWVTMAIGLDAVKDDPEQSGVSGLKVKFWDDGGLQVYLNGGKIFQSSSPFPELRTSSSPTLKVRLVVSQPDFNASGDGYMAMYINNKAYLISDQYIVINQNGFDNNYITFSVDHWNAGTPIDVDIDNLKVVTATTNAITTTAWTGDADSEITGGKVYTHAVNLADTANIVINGQTFTGAGNTATSGSNWEIYTGGSDFTREPGDSANVNVSPASGNLLVNFFWPDNPLGPAYTLTGLTSGQKYVFTIYSRGYGSGSRYNYVATSDGAVIAHINQNEFGEHNGQLLTYKYTANEDGVFTISFARDNASWHCYAFSNCQDSIPEPIYIGIIFLNILLLIKRKF